jgi:hypothetical protein
VKSAAILATDHHDPDPESAEYRRAYVAARDAVVALAGTDLMRAAPDAKPSKPNNADIKLLRTAPPVLTAFVAAHDSYWNLRWGREGNLPSS